MFSSARNRACSGARRHGVRLLLLGFVGLVTAGLPAAAGAGPAPDPVGHLADGVIERTAEAAGSLSGSLGPNRPVAGGQELKGLFRIDRANCGGAPSGSYFRMHDPGGSLVQNTSSGCTDKTYTDLTPGRDGGLSTAVFQPHPDPAFDGDGNGTNDRITMPQGFFGPRFSTATNPKDPQTGTDVALPKVVYDGAGKLSGDLRSFAAGYQRQHFNQGAPKPDGSTPGATKAPAGTYDAATKKYMLEWSSTIVGGPFNNFTGTWHFEGTFDPATKAYGGESPSQPSPPEHGGASPLPVPLPLAGTGPVAGSSSVRPAAAPAPRVSGAVAAGPLKGLFRLTPASCSSSQASGSYFRMIQPNGNGETGPYLPNNDSTCSDKTYTDLTPGKDGGLSTVAYQPQPNPPFDSNGGGANDRITLPKKFFGAFFATATNETDPQTGAKTVLPSVVLDGGGKLSGDLRAFAAGYQNQHFNQGSPKPDGSRPGLTADPTGTLDSATGKFNIQWRSTIVGGPFDKFTGVWHFEGTFEPQASASPVTPPGPGTGTPAAPAAASPKSAPTAARSVPQNAAVSAATSTTPRTGPPWPIGLPVGLLGFGLLGHRLSRQALRTP